MSTPVYYGTMNWKEIFDYDPVSGHLMFRNRPRDHFKSQRACGIFNALSAGRRAGSVRKDGYVVVVISRRQFYAHRIIWEMHHGPIPNGLVVDHKDRNKSRNVIDNLRLATPSENSMNSVHINHSCGLKGVTRNGAGECWSAQITVNRKNIYLGSFPTPEAAHKAYCDAANEYHGQFARIQ